MRDRAVEWHVRVTSDVADEADWLAFEAWLAEAPQHRAAYEAVEQLSSEFDAIGPAEPAKVVQFRPRPRPTRRAALWAGPVAASLIVAGVIGVSLWPDAPPTQSFQTGFGERRAVVLSDGSRVTLNGNSRIAASVGPHERRVYMAEAEAVFDVAHDPSRPFVIQAGDREVRVVGTQFNVLRHQGVVSVTVRRGLVEVRPAGKPDAAALARLTPGQSLVHREGRPSDVVAATDPETAFAWTEGRLIFRGERLADVAVTLNRYVRTPISVAPEAGDVPVTAVMTVGPEDQMLQSLAAFLPVHLDRQPDTVRLTLRRETR
jgi:transmembrane sensor